MTHAKISRIDNVALLTLERGKVNALNELVVDDLTGAFEDLEQDESVSAVVLTGRGKARKMFSPLSKQRQLVMRTTGS